MLAVKYCSIDATCRAADDQAMLEWRMQLAMRLRVAMEAIDMRPADLARAMVVSPQAVDGWLRTGRIHKRHLQPLAAALGQPIGYFLDPGFVANQDLEGPLRYALAARFPSLSTEDIDKIVEYAGALAFMATRENHEASKGGAASSG